MADIPDAQRLDGWKAIANYLGRERTTAIRWANDRGLPVRRVPGGRTGTVYALRSELDAWLESGQHDTAEPTEAAAQPSEVLEAVVCDAAPGPLAPGRAIGRPTRVAALPAVLALLPIAVVSVAWAISRILPGGSGTLSEKPVAAHGMTVRLSGYRPLSTGLPTVLRDPINDEIAAAFNVDGVIGVSTASAPTPGTSPTYSLGGTIYRVGSGIRVITRFTNERSGVVLWSDGVDYAADQVSKAPRKVAVDVGTVVRCGLSGAATYRRLLPDAVMSNYMQYCREYWSYGGSKTLRFAQLVVNAVPDFSWGWSAVGNGFMQAADLESDDQRAEAMRAAGRQAEDKALELDRDNSEALAHKAHMTDPHDLVGREMLFKRAIAAKPLDCGCEHYGYGWTLESVGRLGKAIEQFRAATDMLALWPDSQLALAQALVAADRSDEAQPHFDAVVDLSKDPSADKMLAVTEGTETGDYAGAIAALRSPQIQIPKESRDALMSGYEALASGARQAKMLAIQKLRALPKDKQSGTVATMLAALGANRQALQIAVLRPWLFWRRSMRGVLDEPAFPAAANELGLMTYWRMSRTKPDVCLTESEPTFCRLL